MLPSLEHLVGSFAVVGFRVSGLMLMAPFFGSASLPARFKVSLTLLLTWLLSPAVLGRTPIAPTSGAWTGLACSELAVGLLLGLTVQLVFEASQFAGQVLGVQLGFSLVHVMDPQSQADTPVLGVLQQTIVLLLFLALDVPHHLLSALARSFSLIPPGKLILTGIAVSAISRIFGHLFLAGLQIAAPVLLATMFADVALGFIGKMSPQVPVLFVGLSVKSVLGLAMLSAVLWSWPQFFERAFAGALEQGELLLRSCH